MKKEKMFLILQFLLGISLFVQSDALLDGAQMKSIGMSLQNRTINKIVKIDRYLGKGSFGFVMCGKVNERMVALKFIHKSMIEEIRKEFVMYAVLDAIDNPDVVKKGVPALIYRGNWGDFYIMGISLLGKSLYDKLKEYKKFNATTILLIIQKLIRAFKYIHGRGVIHNDVKTDNILFLYGAELALIDFNCAIVTSRRDGFHNGNNFFAAISYHTGEYRMFKDDMESLFYMMLDISGIRLPWDGKPHETYVLYKKNIAGMRALAQSHPNEDIARVLTDFYDDVMSSHNYFEYDYMFEQIRRALIKVSGKKEQQYFEWIDLTKVHGIPSMPLITSIPGPNDIKEGVVKLPQWSNEHTFDMNKPFAAVNGKRAMHEPPKPKAAPAKTPKVAPGKAGPVRREPAKPHRNEFKRRLK